MTELIHGFSYDKDSDGIVTVVMDMAGPVNSMNAEYREAMEKVVATLEAESDLKGMVLTSAKKTFFAGGNLRDMLEAPKGTEADQFENVEAIKDSLRRLEKLQVPVVAAINGAALGGGLEICLACNHRIIVNDGGAVIGLPEVTLGLLPGGGGVVRSIHMLGLQKALPFLLEGSRLKPAKAVEVGFVDELVEGVEALLPAAKAWIKANPEAWAQPWDVKGHSIPGGNIFTPGNAQMLGLAGAQTYKKTRGLLPAPERILSLANDVIAIDFDAALRVETRALAYLITHPVSKNIINSTFFQLNQINSGASRPQGIAKSKVSKVGILGAGMMGQGISYCAAIAGVDVVLKDVSAEAAEKGKAYTAKLLDKQIARGQKTEADKEAALARIQATDNYEDLQGCDLIIEAVFEKMTLKNQVTKEAESFLKESGIFASNTSTLPITQLAEASADAEKYIGMHFFSPVDKMALVELICGDKTSDETLAKAFDFVRQIRKTPIVVTDSLGFFTSRVFATFLDEGNMLLKEGVDPVLIDAMGKQVGMPVGPLTIQDEVSLELVSKIGETHKELGVYCSVYDTSVSFDLCGFLSREHKRGGRHYGGGFYDYHADGSKTIWPTLYELYHKPEVHLPEQDIKDRILFRQVVESLKCLQEGVLKSVADGNIGSLFGIGAPTWTGGFIQVVNTYEYKGQTGPQAFLTRTEELAAAYGERFAAPSILREKAEVNGRFA
ncbi:3-hydroxyacyl-CoA dehydrogenase NAD-binding domain-containing protein [Halioxenophilus sp. WMMB6]|uniref:3-hydroxyacyl-CoA dehydrogenase NAD-binding domain-containing protein n=1 Tax=Halioxenophilus sp. WMMB6 TaxID=3073815 RepID=UPI00295EF97B|nr:3-hydroxyacyl-CoA dehydrogenase NAD-binding domain-containing protein [Halioxenophilus sp. WMMB6]